MQLQGLILSEFNDKKGFQLVVSVPTQSPLTQQQFDLCSQLMLPKQQLCERLLAIEYMQRYFIIGMPSLSRNHHDKAYSREKYIYCLTLLVCKEDYLKDVKRYKDLAKQLARFFKAIEQTNHVIYFHGQFKDYLFGVMQRILLAINTCGECNLTYLCKHYAFINLKAPPVARCNRRLAAVTHASVPVTVLKMQEIGSIQSDLGKKLMVYACEGVLTFRKICKLHSDRKESELKEFYEVAIKKGMVFMLDLFLLTNVYALGEGILDLVADVEGERLKVEQVAQAIRLPNCQPLTREQVIALYLQFNRITPLYKILQKHPMQAKRISLLKLVRLGQIHGWLHRIYQKVVYSTASGPLLDQQLLKRYLEDPMGNIQRSPPKGKCSPSKLQHHMSVLNGKVQKQLSQQDFLEQQSVNLQIEPNSLLKLLPEENRYVLQVNPRARKRATQPL